MTRSASNDRRRPLPVTSTTTTNGDNDNISDSDTAAMTANTHAIVTPGMNESHEKFSSTDTSPPTAAATATTTTSSAAPNTKDPPQQNDQQPEQVEEQKGTKSPKKDDGDKDEKNEEKTEDNDVTDEKGLLTCMVCWATSDGSVPSASASSSSSPSPPNFITLPCNHSGCHSCIVCWIERCELNGLDEPTCPHCRQSIQPDVSTSILERPYQRMSQAPTTPEDAMLIDDLTQDWLNDDQLHTHQCTNCGMYTIREEEDEDDGAPNLVSCGLCGHIYCWKCHCDYKQCYDRYRNNNNDDNDNDSSNEYDGDYESEHMDFYDPTSQVNFPANHADKFPIATREEITSNDSDDMERFQTRRRKIIESYQRDRYERIENASYVFLTSVFDECTEPADYVWSVSCLWEYEYTEDASGWNSQDLKRQQLQKSHSESIKDVGFSTSIQRDGLEAIRAMIAATDILQPDRTVGVATEAFRQATNGRQFATTINDTLCIPITIVPVHIGARWGFQTAVAVSDIPPTEVISSDCGAGSIQFSALYHGTHEDSQRSGTVEALARSIRSRMINDSHASSSIDVVDRNEMLLRTLKDDILQPMSHFKVQQSLQLSTFQIIAIGSQHSIFNQQRISLGHHVFNRDDVQRCWNRAVAIESISTDRLIDWELEQSRLLVDGDDNDRNVQRRVDNAPFLVPKLTLLLAIMEKFDIAKNVTFYKTNGNCHALLTQQPWLWES